MELAANPPTDPLPKYPPPAVVVGLNVLTYEGVRVAANVSSLKAKIENKIRVSEDKIARVFFKLQL